MTREDARRLFDKAGTSISDWAREHGFSRVMVHQVLSGRCTGRRGQAHRIALALGIKDGIPGGSPKDYDRLAKAKRRAA